MGVQSQYRTRQYLETSWVYTYFGQTDTQGSEEGCTSVEEFGRVARQEGPEKNIAWKPRIQFQEGRGECPNIRLLETFYSLKKVVFFSESYMSPQLLSNDTYSSSSPQTSSPSPSRSNSMCFHCFSHPHPIYMRKSPQFIPPAQTSPPWFRLTFFNYRNASEILQV